MPIVDLPADEEMAAAVARIDAWAERELAAGGFLVAAERQEVTDRTASYRWYLRFKGDEKDFITVWFTLKQRTLHFEAQFMPAPETNQADVFAYLLRRNAHLFGMWFALGPEDAVYLVGRVPARLIDDDELDRIAGSSVALHRRALPDRHDLGPPLDLPPPAPPLTQRRRRRGRPHAGPWPRSVSSRAVSSLLIVGGGKMGGALLGGLLRSGWAEAADVTVVEPVAERRDELAGRVPRVAHPGRARGRRLLGDGGERVAGAVLAVKPDAAEGACRALGPPG